MRVTAHDLQCTLCRVVIHPQTAMRDTLTAPGWYHLPVVIHSQTTMRDTFLYNQSCMYGVVIHSQNTMRATLRS